MDAKTAKREMLAEMPVRWRGVVYHRINALIYRTYNGADGMTIAEKRGAPSGAVVMLELLRNERVNSVELAPIEEVEEIPVDVV